MQKIFGKRVWITPKEFGRLRLLKEGTTSVNSNYKSSHVASNFMVICIMLTRRVMYEILKIRLRSL